MNTWSPTIRSGCPSQCFNCPCQRKVKANGPSFPSVYLFVFCFCKAYNPSFPVTFLTLQIIRIFLLSWWDLFSNFGCQSWKLSIWELSVRVPWLLKSIKQSKSNLALLAWGDTYTYLIFILQQPWIVLQFQRFSKCFWPNSAGWWI